MKTHFLNSQNIKQLSNTDTSVCVINSQSLLLCEDTVLGKFNVVVPEVIKHDAMKVMAGVNSTAAINSKGQLKFWWNYPK